jgi:phosphoglycolate phosphatase
MPNRSVCPRTRETGTVICDLDGTLVDSAPDIADALEELLLQKGLLPIGLDGTRKLIGHGISNLVRRAMIMRRQYVSSAELASVVSSFQEFYAKRLPAKAVVYPGVIEGLDSLKADHWRLVVCTNKLESFSRSILDGLGLLSFFDLVAGPDTFGVAKPDPRHLLRTLPADMPSSYKVIMIGDSEVDVETAQAARIPVIAVNYGYSKKQLLDLQPEAVADSFSEVPSLVKKHASEQGRQSCAS